MPGRGFLVFALAALLGAATTACQSNDTAVAGATAMRYLDALGAAPDRGWSLLTGSRTATDEASYTRALELLDWDQFRYEVTDAHCDDGACSVWMAVDGAPGARPGTYLGALLIEEKPGKANAVLLVSQRTFDDGVVFPAFALQR